MQDINNIPSENNSDNYVSSILFSENTNNINKDNNLISVDSDEERKKAQNEIIEKNLNLDPKIKTELIFQDYLRNKPNLFLSGKQKRIIKRDIFKKVLKGKYDYLFKPSNLNK